MSDVVQYVTNQQGERVGVLLDLETYHRLVNSAASDAELLTELSMEELKALADSQLASVTISCRTSSSFNAIGKILLFERDRNLLESWVKV
jgi:hypothetical protein